jgi:hypothetical protein
MTAAAADALPPVRQRCPCKEFFSGKSNALEASAPTRPTLCVAPTPDFFRPWMHGFIASVRGDGRPKVFGGPVIPRITWSKPLRDGR